MALNPANKQGSLNNPTQRANELNDPQFSNEQGYFPYDLTHQSFITPNFGNITPTMVLDTVPGDRTVVRDNTKLVLNRINGNFLSTMNQYVDSFYIPMRSVFPMNYEKLIPNPTKGDDLPNSALPQFPLGGFVMNYIKSDNEIDLLDSELETHSTSLRYIFETIMSGMGNDLSEVEISYFISRLTLLATVLSRGQLLDYLEIGLDVIPYEDNTVISKFQQYIDNYFEVLYKYRSSYLDAEDFMLSIPVVLTSDEVLMESYSRRFRCSTLSEWRQSISDIMERGEMISFKGISFGEGDFEDAVFDLLKALEELFLNGELLIDSGNSVRDYINELNGEAAPFKNGQYINIGKVLAYQQVVAQYYTNDTIDNIFTSDLYMQLLRGIMFPADEDGITHEPTFDYNGVPTEYDYISVGAIAYSLLSDEFAGKNNRQYVWMTLMFLLRRSLRYGDYFSTCRPNMLAIGQLGVNVENGSVSPIDITKNLLMQRYLNAVNRCGSQFLNYFASIHGITPSDTGTFPRFISHRKIEIQNQLTNNTGEEQGKQTTNLVAYSDNTAFDVFIDDFGYLISVTTFDVLPVYTSGIDSTYHFSDRFDMMNPMMQGIGDQAVRSSEILGSPDLYNDTFGYVTRNSEYKYKISKAHGAFVGNDLAGWMFKYPITSMVNTKLVDTWDLVINPDFIRDKAAYLDNVIPANSGYSPAQYFQFVVSCTNEVHSARKIQATPPVLF